MIPPPQDSSPGNTDALSPGLPGRGESLPLDELSLKRHGLAGALTPRHLSIIALGGVIGAGLLVASSGALLAAGPGILVSYLIAGVLVVLVMRMLGEMATAHPETGSFSAYASRFIGPWAGLAIGWMYWWFWVVVVGIEATAAAMIVTAWVPGMPQWVPALLVTIACLAINLFSVRSFGEFEFWFASVKVIAIVLFIGFGLLILLGIVPSSYVAVHPGEYGGFFPNGFPGVLVALLPIVFSLFGVEVATIAAGESQQPQQAVRRAVNTVLWRVLLFYIGSMTVVIALVPWTAMQSGISPFVTALEFVGIPWAAVVMDGVILTALISTLNAGLYTASRMAFSLARREEAPRILQRVDGRGSPYVAILASALVGLVSVGLNYSVPEQVFAFLVNSTGATALFVWLVIAIAQLRSRTIDPHAYRSPGVMRAWGYPMLTWLVIVAVTVLLGYMTVNPDPQTRLELAVSFAVASVCAVCGVVVQRNRTKSLGSINHQRNL